MTAATDSVVIRLRGVGRERLRFLAQVLAAPPVGVALSPARPLAVLFMDTDDSLLRRAGVALGIDVAGDSGAASVQLLSGATPLPEDIPLREEIGPVTGEPAGALLVSGVARGVMAALGIDRLRASAELRGERIECPLPDPQGRIVIDILAVAGAREETVLVEIAVSGGVGIREVAEHLAEKLDLSPARKHLSDFARAATGVETPKASPGDFDLRREDRFVDAAYRVLGRCLAQMRWNEPGTRLGLEPECLHDMRVATRRLRAALKVFGAALPPKRTAAFEAHLAWISDALGKVRDLDVHLEAFDEEASNVTAESRPALELYRALLTRQRTRARREMLRALSSRRYARLVGGLAAFLSAGPPKRPRAALARRPADRAAAAVIRNRFDSVTDSGASVTPESPDAELHRLRIRCKRLRYACECFVDLYGKPVRRFARRVARLQGVLGDHQDAVTARETLAALTRSAAVPRRQAREFALALGQLTQWHTQRAAVAREEFFRRWRKFTRKKTRRAVMEAMKADGESRSAQRRACEKGE